MPTLRSLRPPFLLVPVALVALTSVALADWVPTTRPGEELPKAKELGTAQVVCDGQDTLALADQTLETEGLAILADGNCVLDLTNVDVTSRDSFALVVKGKAKVTIRDSSLEGGLGAVGMDGTAVIDAQRSEFWGGFVRSGDGSSFVEDGSNGFWQAPLEELLIDG